MADKKISQLPAATTPLAGTEVLPIVQSSTTDQVSVANLTAGRDVSGLSFSGGNVKISGNAIESTNTNGDISIVPNGLGNIGVCKTASTGWNVNTRVQDGNAGSVIDYTTIKRWYSQNGKFVPGATWQYVNTAGAALYEQSANTHTWSTAASGSAGAALTWTANLGIDSSGNVNVNTGNLVIGTSGKGVAYPVTTGGSALAPAFSAYSNASQTLGTASFTKITFGAEEYDTNNNFASSTFTPTVAGYYQISGSLNINSSQCQIIVAVYKNGSLYKSGPNVNANSSYSGVNCQVYLNGTTDYVEIYGFVATGQSTGNNQAQTYFQGCMIRGA